MTLETKWAIEIIITIIAIPWCIFVTTSIFNQRQEIALLKLEIEQNKEIHKLLHEIIEKLDG
jgi:hypothetical protein